MISSANSVFFSPYTHAVFCCSLRSLRLKWICNLIMNFTENYNTFAAIYFVFWLIAMKFRFQNLNFEISIWNFNFRISIRNSNVRFSFLEIQFFECRKILSAEWRLYKSCEAIILGYSKGHQYLPQHENEPPQSGQIWQRHALIKTDAVSSETSNANQRSKYSNLVTYEQKAAYINRSW